MRNGYYIGPNVLKYLKGRLQMEMNEYDQRLGANEPGDFPHKRFSEERELVESKSSECKYILISRLRPLKCVIF